MQIESDDMSLQIAVADLDHDNNVCRVTITTGNVETRSYPQPLSDNFRDLYANRRLISERKLASFFFGDEPILNIEYINDDFVHAYIFRETAGGSEKIEGDFSIKEALLRIDDALTEIEAASGLSEQDKKSLLDQVSQDMALGAYDAYQMR